MITKYEVCSFASDLIEKCEFSRETEKFLVKSNGVRVAKDSEYSHYFDSFDDAKEFKLIKLKNKREEINKSLQKIADQIQVVIAFTEELCK